MSERIRTFIDEHRPAVEVALCDYLPLSRNPGAAELDHALRYALFPGGKRWRPILTLLGAGIVGGSVKAALPAACAMEYLHTSSIILDDLPAMDDAQTRRGRKSLHLVYGESIALLAALALLNESYALLALAAKENGFCESVAGLIEEASRNIGSNGMIGGQILDLALNKAERDPAALAGRNLKTTALMRLTMSSGAIVCGADKNEALALAGFGELLGAAYQICDDLLDELGAEDELGKPARQDHRHCRPNFAAELGAEGALRLASSLIEEGIRSLRKKFGDHPTIETLAEAASLILERAGRLTMAAA